MLRSLIGSEFKGGAAKWNERSPADFRLTRGDFEQSFKIMKEHVIVDKCAKQKTNMEEEYPRNDGKPKQPGCIEYDIP